MQLSRTLQKATPTITAAVQALILFTAGLYCLGFGLKRELNFHGVSDALLPYEWLYLTIVGIICIAWSTWKYVEFYRQLTQK